MGCSVFPGKKYNEVLAQNRSCDFSFDREEYQSLSPNALHLLRGMLAKDPKARMTAASALCAAYF
jgi:serine/threonine protein kinase